MHSDRERAALLDIHDNIMLAENFTKDQAFESFRRDLMRLYAATRCLEIISEASRRLSQTLKDAIQAFPGGKWRAPAIFTGTNTSRSRRTAFGIPSEMRCPYFVPLSSKSSVKVGYPPATVWITSKPSNSGWPR
jgi:hypothetical protein